MLILKKYKRLKLALPGLFILCLFSAFSILYPGGAPGGYTGSPSDVSNCTSCHGGSLSTVAGIILCDVDTAGYIPGQTYKMSVNVPGSGNKGFEVSPQNLKGDLLGTLIPGVNTLLKNNDKYLTHAMTSGGNPTTWNFQWKAPSKGTGNVTFYGAFAAGKYSTLLSTLTIKENTTSTIKEDRGFNFSVFPNPVVDQINIEFSMKNRSKLKVQLSSPDGKTVFNLIENEYMPGNYNFRLNCPENIQPGVYLIRFYINNRTEYSTLIKL